MDTAGLKLVDIIGKASHQDHESAPLLGPYSDCFKYRWIRANRGNLAIDDALRHARWDADFDALIEAAIRMSVESRASLQPNGTGADPPEDRRSS